MDATTVGDLGVIVLTGMPGAGKTTTGRALVKALDRDAAHIEEDRMWSWLTDSGEVGRSDPDVDGLRRRGEVFLRSLASLVDALHDQGFTPIIEGAILRRSHLEDRVRRMRAQPVHLVVLAPSDEVCRARDADRPKTVYPELRELEDTLRGEFGGIGLWIDNGGLTPDETVAELLARLDEARIDFGVRPPGCK